VRHQVFSVAIAGAIGVLAIASGSSAASGTPASHTPVWEDSALNVICGVENPALSKTKVLCQGPGVPRPPHSSPAEGDPAVTLAAAGKPQLVLISQDSYPSGASIRKLGAGRTWNSRGVTCTIGAHAVSCKNGAKHGFTFRNHHYKAF
jgi:hypothetical protein